MVAEITEKCVVPVYNVIANITTRMSCLLLTSDLNAFAGWSEPLNSFLKKMSKTTDGKIYIYILVLIRLSWSTGTIAVMISSGGSDHLAEKQHIMWEMQH